MVTSLKKITANRLNALQSTGPRTAIAKRRTRFNALREGFNAAILALPGEDLEECERFITRFFAQIEPVGELEVLRFNIIARDIRRLRRVLRADHRAEAKAVLEEAKQAERIANPGAKPGGDVKVLVADIDAATVQYIDDNSSIGLEKRADALLASIDRNYAKLLELQAIRKNPKKRRQKRQRNAEHRHVVP